MTMRKVSYWVLLVIGTLRASAGIDAVLPADLQGVPVEISIPLTNGATGFGTGVYLLESNIVWLVTAAHVLWDGDGHLFGTNVTLRSLPRGRAQTNHVVLTADLERINGYSALKRHPTRDVAACALFLFTPTNGTGAHPVLGVKVISSPDIHIMISEPKNFCKKVEDVDPGSEAFVIGYPRELAIGNYSEVEFERPLVRKGIISQKNLKTGKLIVDSAVYGGNSGGPLRVVENPSLGEAAYKMVGVVTQYVPCLTRVAPGLGVTNSVIVNSGYSVAEPISAVLELIKP
jgi:hypothetical protein